MAMVYRIEMKSVKRPRPDFLIVSIFLMIWGCAIIPAVAEEPISSDEPEYFGENWGQGFIAKDMSGWITDFEYVEVVVYDSMPPNKESPVVAEKLNDSVAKAWTKRLTPEEVTLLTTFITGKREDDGSSGCDYDPHHGFVFYGKDSKILGYIEICFMCRSYRWSPQGELSSHWDLEGLSALVAKKGLPTFKHPDEWAKFFADKELVKKGKMDQPTADEKIAE